MDDLVSGPQIRDTTVLEELGLDSNLSQLYSAALDQPGLSLSQLAEFVGFDEQTADTAFRKLKKFQIGSMYNGTVSVVPPEQAVDLVILRQQRKHFAKQVRLSKNQIIAEGMKTLHARELQPQRDELISGELAVQVRLKRLCNETMSQMDVLAPGSRHSAEQVELAKFRDQEMFARGVVSRTVFLDSAINDRHTLSYAEWLSGQGAEVRAVPKLPIRMIIADKSLAVLPGNQTDASLGMALYRAAAVVKALQELFEHIWAGARMFGPTPIPRPAELSDSELTILSMFARGASEKEIAQKLGVVDRTVRRRVESAIGKLNAINRTAAIYRATKAGLI